MDLATRHARDRRDTDHKAGPPRFHKKRYYRQPELSAPPPYVAQIKYNGKLRIRLPVIGSVNLRPTLPKGLVYEAHIKFLNGSVEATGQRTGLRPLEWPEQHDRIEAGSVDTKHQPRGHRQRRRGLGESEGLLPSRAQARTAGSEFQTRRTKQSRGSWEAQRKIDRLQRHANGLRRKAVHQMTGTLVRKFKNLVIEDLNVRGMMPGPTPKAFKPILCYGQ